MSLYDDATFIFSGEAAAGAPHKAYSLKPVEKLKPTVLNANSDLSTSGSLSASTNSLGLVLTDSTDATASIANGVVTITTGANGSAKGRVYTTNGTTTAYLENGKAYNLTYTVVENNGVTTFQYSEDGVIRSAPSTVGTHAVSFKRGQTNDSPYFYLQTQTPSANIVLKDIIVREAEQRSLDFRVSRDANLGATRVKADGLIEKGRENLIRYSNTLTDSSWGISDVVYNDIAGGKQGYDGSNTAFLIDKITTGNSYVGIPVLTYDGVFTWSGYFKNEGSKDNGVYMFTPEVSQYFNLANGQKISSPGGTNPIASSIESVGGGWYRCSITGVGDIDSGVSNDRPRFKVTNIDGSDPGTGTYNDTGKIFVQDFQFEASLVATDYIDSKSMTGTAGLQANEPRYDYLTSTNDCPGALVEPTRINMVTNSEYFGDYDLTNTTISSTFETSPEGLKNAYKVLETSATGASHKFVAPAPADTYTHGTAYSVSVFAKAAGRTKFRLQAGTVSEFPFKADFTLTGNGTAAAASGNDANSTVSIENYGNGWYRCKIEGFTVDLDAGSGTGGTKRNIFLLNDSGSASYDGDTTKGVIFYGYQLEAGPWCTSYMPTYGSSVTRERDHFISPVDYDEYATEDFTVFIDYKDFKSNGASAAGLWRAVYGNATSRSIFQYNLSIGYEGFPSLTPSTPGSEYSSNHATEGANKIAVVYNRDSVAVYVDGVQTKLDYSVDTTKKGISHMQLLYGESKMTLNRCMVFNRPLTKDEAIALTT
jgi:hypothetical protein